MLGATKLNPFGDLHALQHLSARFARTLRGVFEPLLRQEVRTFAEPLVVQRFADYRAERPEGLTAWLPLAMGPSPSTQGQSLCVLDGRFVLELLDLFFGGTGAAPAHLPTEFSPAAEAMIARIGGASPRRCAPPGSRSRASSSPAGASRRMPAMLHGMDGDDAMIVTRFGIAAGTAKPVFVDLVYPVAALKPHGTALTGKVVSKSAEPDAAWRAGLTRAAMGVPLPGPLGARRAGRAAVAADGPQARRRHPDQLRRRRAGDGRQATGSAPARSAPPTAAPRSASPRSAALDEGLSR